MNCNLSTLCKMHSFFPFHSTIGLFRNVGQFYCIFRQLFAFAYFDYSLLSKYIILRHISCRFINCFMDISTIFLSIIFSDPLKIRVFSVILYHICAQIKSYAKICTFADKTRLIFYDFWRQYIASYIFHDVWKKP